MSVLAIDLGAESGRVMRVSLGDSLTLEEVHRFANRSVQIRGTRYWAILELFRNVTEGIHRALDAKPQSLGVDTWAVDFALLDAADDLLSAPVHYRDPRTENMMPRVFERIARAELFAETGIQMMKINTVYQLMSLVARDHPQLGAARTFLTVPDLLNYWLTGEKACEYTNATTTQLVGATSRDWSPKVLGALGLSADLFPAIVPPGTALGRYNGVQVTLPAAHDTGSAVVGVPVGASVKSENFAYISSGTWSLVGIETDAPVLSEAARAANLTNEGGVGGTFRLLKNVMGLWVVQQCREHFEKRYSYADLVALAQEVQPLRSLVHINHPDFLQPGDHPTLIREHCQRTHQRVPETPGEVIRCALESLALAYRAALDDLARVSGQAVEVIHIVGGGSRNALLNQLTADATGRPVTAGPAEATVLGNAAVQLIALGELSSVHEARSLITHSLKVHNDATYFEPRATHQAVYADAFARYQSLTQTGGSP